eukprot:symbB.v1.2.024629.t1/scaffold2332.1/size82080/2
MPQSLKGKGEEVLREVGKGEQLEAVTLPKSHGSGNESSLRVKVQLKKDGLVGWVLTRPEIIGGTTVSADQEDRHERSDRSNEGSKAEPSDVIPERDEPETRAQSIGPCFRMLLHGVAIAIVVALVVCAVGGVILMVVQSVLRLQDDWKVYKKGAEHIAQAVQRLMARVTGSMPAAFAEDISQNVLEKVEDSTRCCACLATFLAQKNNQPDDDIHLSIPSTS